MRNVAATLRVRTSGSGLLEITSEVRAWLEKYLLPTVQPTAATGRGER